MASVQHQTLVFVRWIGEWVWHVPDCSAAPVESENGYFRAEVLAPSDFPVGWELAICCSAKFPRPQKDDR